MDAAGRSSGRPKPCYPVEEGRISCGFGCETVDHHNQSLKLIRNCDAGPKMLDEDEVLQSKSWLEVIAKSLAHLTLKTVEKERPFNSVIDRVDFLEGLGLSTNDAARVAGTTKASVTELRYQARKKKGTKSGKGKTKKRSRRGK
jgi:hypothetical protein